MHKKSAIKPKILYNWVSINNKSIINLLGLQGINEKFIIKNVKNIGGKTKIIYRNEKTKNMLSKMWEYYWKEER